MAKVYQTAQKGSSRHFGRRDCRGLAGRRSAVVTASRANASTVHRARRQIRGNGLPFRPRSADDKSRPVLACLVTEGLKRLPRRRQVAAVDSQDVGT